MTSRRFGLQSIPESSDRGPSCQAHGWQRSPRKRCWAIWVESRDREPAPRWRSPCRVEPPQTKLSIAAHAKSDGSMQRSLQEITEVLQASTGLLGSCLSREALYAWACIYAIDKAEKLSPLLLAYKPRWSSLLPIHSALLIHLRSISQSNRPDSPSCTSSGCERPSLPTMLGLNKPVDEPGAAWPGITVGLFASFAGILYG